MGTKTVSETNLRKCTEWQTPFERVQQTIFSLLPTKKLFRRSAKREKIVNLLVISSKIKIMVIKHKTLLKLFRVI